MICMFARSTALVVALVIAIDAHAGDCDIALPIGSAFGLNDPLPFSNHYGQSLDVDGLTAVIGDPQPMAGVGRAHIYDFNEATSEWAITQSFGAPSGEKFGWAVGISGDTIVVGAHGGSDAILGLAYVYERTNGIWSLSSTLTTTTNDPLDRFGLGVAIEGTTIVVGAFNADEQMPGAEIGAAYVYERPPGGWPTTMFETATLRPPMDDIQENLDFGYSIAISGGVIVVSAPNAHIDPEMSVGALYVYEDDGSGWSGVIDTPSAKLTASEIQFGLGVGGAYGLDMWNNDIVAGASGYDLDDGLELHVNAGAVLIWSRPPGGWVDATEDAFLTAVPGGIEAASWPGLGYSTAIGDGIVLAGAPWTDIINSTVDEGAVYVFVRPPTGWQDLGPSGRLDSGNDFGFGAPDMRFGNDVAISGSLAMVGAPRMFTTSGTIGGAYPYDVGDCPLEPIPGVSVWQLTGDCVFSDDGNWFPVSPSSVDTARIEQPGSFDLCLDGNEVIGALECVQGTAQLDLAGWTFDLSNDTSLGDALVVSGIDTAPASLLIDGTGMVRAESEVRIAENAGDIGTLTIAGVGTSLLVDNANITAGQAGVGTLAVTGGALVQCESASVGLLPGSDGVMRIDGAGSTFQADNFILVPFGRLEVFDEGLIDLVSPLGAIFVESEAQIVGDGTVDGNIVVSGDVGPGGDGAAVGGNAIGTLTVDGAVDLKGRVIVDVDTDLGVSDVVDVTGIAYLAGGLVVRNLGAPDPIDDEPYPVLTAAATSGVFDVALLPGLAGSKFMRVDYGGVGPTGVVDLVVEDLGELFGGFDDPETLSLGGLPSGALLATLDADEFPDLAIALPDADPMNDGSVIVLINNGTDGGGAWLGFGATIQVAVGREPSGITAGQLNADGVLDLAVSNALDDSATVLINDIGGGGSFLAATLAGVGTEPLAIAAGDFTENGEDDIAVALGGSDEVIVFENDGSANFAQAITIAVGSRPCAIDPTDLDDDKDTDLIVGNCMGASITTVRFERASAPDVLEIPVGVGPEAIASADLDQNGFADILTANRIDSTISVVLNDGAGTFRPPVDLPVGADPRSLTEIDLEGDGDLDVALVANDEFGDPVVQVLRNDLNNGTQLAFATVEDLVAGTDPVFVLEGDIDQDATSDLVAVNEGDGASPGPAQGSVNAFVNTTAPCPADLDGTTDVGFQDLLLLLASWGPCPPECVADLDGDGTIGFQDLLLLLASWGVCP